MKQAPSLWKRLKVNPSSEFINSSINICIVSSNDITECEPTATPSKHSTETKSYTTPSKHEPTKKIKSHTFTTFYNSYSGTFT